MSTNEQVNKDTKIKTRHIRVDFEIHKKIKFQAIKEDTSITKLVTKLLSNYLNLISQDEKNL